MRVLVLTPYFFPHAGGSQQYIADVFSAVRKKHPDVAVDVICYNTDGAKAEEVYQGLNIYRVPCWEILRGQFALPHYGAVWQLVRRLKRTYGGYAVVNAHTRFFDTSWYGWWVARYMGARSVLTDHCAFHPQHASAVVRLVARLVDSFLAPWVARCYDQVVSVSEATRSFLKGLGVPKSVVMYGGVKHVASGEGRIPGVKVDKNDVVVSFVGRLIPQKGAGLLVNVAKRMAETHPHVQFVFAGEGPEKEVVSSAQSEQIHYVGQLGRNDVLNVLQASDVFVLPSEHHEGLPLALVEAAGAGCALVATRRGGVNEVVVDGETGMLIERSEASLQTAVVKLVEDAGLRKRLGTGARKLASERFDLMKNAEEFYQRVLS
jgi:glycosyltransferase involved in cell wall biosynthesis